MLLGYFDRLGRAILRVRSSNGIELQLEIDTGAEPAMIVDRETAVKLCKELSTGHTATLADQSTRDVLAGTVSIEWHDGVKEIEVIAWTDGAPQRTSKNRIDGLAGRKLFQDAELNIDFVNRRVRVSKVEDIGA